MFTPPPRESSKNLEQQARCSQARSSTLTQPSSEDRTNTLVNSFHQMATQASTPESNSVYLPQTRYYGSKRRLVQWMLGEFNKYNFTTAVDVFGGTSTVSLALKHINKKVTYNDLLESNRTIATALLSNEQCATTHFDLEQFYDSIQPTSGFISEHYAGIYYTNTENMWLDGAIAELSKIENHLKKSEILYCLMQACLQKRPFNLFHRKNLYLRENNTKDTKFGNWATWERPFSVLMSRALSEIHKTRWSSEFTPTVLPCTDAIDIPAEYDFVYLDPPYVPVKKQDISYMDRYHFLEGICMPERWAGMVDLSKRNHPIPSPESMLKWTDKKTFKENLFSLIEKHEKSIVCLSYVHDAFPEIETISNFFKTQFKDVTLLEHDMPHALSKKPKKEVIIIGAP
ncbi:DNA adenine methylase [Pseudomonas sp. NPDC090201]|uniref:DNA adenine methylase n=1 Tax=Pseudomonas sp. NPDC090201 TaxID=3364475 RepID=UPI0037F786C4